MNREYYKWFSPALNRDMELLVFGHGGTAVLFFPTRTARFYDYEDWHIIESLKGKVEAGHLTLFCVDSIDRESFYCSDCPPSDRIKRHIHYENYILNEVIPLIHNKTPGTAIISAGCSMGAFHAVNIAFRHPWLFQKVVAMSGRFDLTRKMGSFNDLFDGYRDEDIYFNTPNMYIANLEDQNILEQLRKLDIIIAIGQDDAFLENNRHMSRILWDHNISNSLYIWTEEAHKARYWREMVRLYL